MKAIKKWLRKKFIDWLIRDLFVVVDERDLFYVEDGVAYFGGKPLAPEDYERLRVDAERFRRSYLWSVLSRRMKWEATDKIANKSQTVDDIVGGKLLLYLVKVIENVIDQIKS